MRTTNTKRRGALPPNRPAEPLAEDPAASLVDRRPEHLVLAGTVVLGSVTTISGVLDPSMLPKLTVVLVGVVQLVALAAGRAIADRRLHLPAGPWLWAVAAYAGALVLVTVTSSNRTVSVLGVFGRWTGLVPYLTYLVLLAVVVTLGRAVLAPLAVALLVALAAVVVYGMAQVVGVDPVDWQSEVAATPIFSAFGNVNFVSGWTGAVLPLAVWAALGSTDQRLRIALWALVGGSAVLLWQAGSAQGPIAAGAGLALLLAVWCAEQRGGSARATMLRRLGPRVIAAGCVVAVAAVAAFVALRPDAGVTQRLHFWDAALAIFADHPLVGSGLDTYNDLFLAERSAEGAVRYGLERNEAPHSVPLGMLSNGGVVLGLAYLAFVVVIGVALVGGLRRLRGDERLLLAAFGAVWVGYQVQSLVSFDVPPVAMLHHLAAGAVVVLAVERSTRLVELPGYREHAKRRRRAASGPAGADVAAIGLVAVVAIALSVVATRPLRADLTVGSAATLLDEGRGPEALDRIRRGVELAPNEPSYQALLASLLVQAGEAGEAYDRAAEAATLDPGSVQLALTAGELAAQLGRPDDARRWYDEALGRDPNDPDTLVALARGLSAGGDDEEAVRLLARAVELEPNITNLVALGQAQAGIGDPAAAVTFERALALEPENEVAAQGLAELTTTS